MYFNLIYTERIIHISTVVKRAFVSNTKFKLSLISAAVY